MSNKTKIILIAVFAFVFVLVGTARAETFRDLFANPVIIPPENIVEIPPATQTAPPVPQPRPLAYPTEAFWDRLAYCETRNDQTHPYGNWQNGGRFAGGLGIMTEGTFAKGVLGQGNMGTWERWGGEEFAPSPDKATREQQIIVANRIAIEGWKTTVDRGVEFAQRKGVPRYYEYDKSPVGFGGWGALPCAGGTPARFFYAEEHHGWLASQSFVMGQTGVEVHDLQGLVGVKQDGKYGKFTRKAHLAWLEKNGLSTAGVPALG